MKTFAAVAGVAALAAFASAEECDYAVVGPTLHTLADPLADCMTASGYNLADYSATPTDEQKAAVCTGCTSLIDALNDMTWPDCTMDMGGVNQTLTAYFANIIGDCDTAGSQYTSVTDVATTDSSAAATTTVGSTASSTAGSTAAVGSGSSDATVETPSAGSTASSTASSGSASAGSNNAVSASMSAAAFVVCSVAAAFAL